MNNLEHEPKVGDYALINEEVFAVNDVKGDALRITDIDHRGCSTVQKVEVGGIEPGYQRWFYVEDVKIITREDNPEYFL